jgi:PAS domain S-box-containing protein
MRVLLVEDSLGDAVLVRQSLEAGIKALQFSHVADLSGAVRLLDEAPFDAVLADFSLPRIGGLDVICRIVAAAKSVPVIAMGDSRDKCHAQAAIQNGAQDFLLKEPYLYPALPRILTYAIERSRMLERQLTLVRERDIVEGLMSAVLLVSRECIGFLDRRGAFELASPALCRLTGYSASALIGKPLTTILTPANPETVKKMLVSGAQEQVTVESFAVAILTKDGSRLPVMLSVTAVRLSDIGDHFVVKVDPEDTAGGSLAVSSESALRERLSECGGKVVANHMEMIGLGRIKDELGPNWPKYAKRIEEVAVRIITSHLEPEAVFEKIGDGEFLVCFASLSESDAAFKARAITRQIQEKILGGDDGSGISAEILADAAEIRSETISAELSEEDLASDQSIASLVKQKMAEERKSLRKHASATFRALAEHYKLGIAQSWTRYGKRGKLAVAVADADSRARIERLIMATGAAPNIVRDIDIIHLGRIATLLTDNLDPNLRLVLTEVSYHTVASPDTRQSFLESCHGLDDPIRERMAFLLKDIPIGTHEDQISRCLEDLSPFSGAQAVQFNLHQLMRTELGALATKLFVLSYDAVQPILYGQNKQSAEKFEGKLSEGRFMVLGVPDAERAKHLKRFRIDAYTLDPSQLRTV